MSSHCTHIIIRNRVRTICNSSVWNEYQFCTFHRCKLYIIIIIVHKICNSSVWEAWQFWTLRYKGGVSKIIVHKRHCMYEQRSASTSQTVGLITHRCVHVHTHRCIKIPKHAHAKIYSVYLAHAPKGMHKLRLSNS